jgi:hypothetical protein
MEPSYDEQSDEQIDAIAYLLAESLRAKFGPDIIAKVYTWPVRLDLAPMIQFPCLVVYRDSDRQEVASQDEDVETMTVRVDYYAPKTPLDRIELRWPVLRNVWKWCIGILRMGRDPEVDDGDRILDAADIDAPSLAVGTARYLIAPADSDFAMPCFQASVTLTSTKLFEDLFEDGVAISRIHTTAMSDGSADADPDEVDRAFDADIT